MKNHRIKDSAKFYHLHSHLKVVNRLLPSAAHTVPLLSQLHSMPAALLSGHPMVLVPLLPSGPHGALGFSSIQCLLKGTFRDSNPVVHCLSLFLSESMGQNSGTTFSLYFPCLKPVPRGQCCQVLLPTLDAAQPHPRGQELNQHRCVNPGETLVQAGAFEGQRTPSSGAFFF